MIDVLTTWILLFINIIESQDFCIWNAYESGYVNGLYKKQGKSETGDDSYSISIASDCIGDQGKELFIYRQKLTNRWTISASLDSTDAQYMKGTCSFQQSDITFLDCSTNWQIPAGISQASVTSKPASSCQQVQCDALQLSFADNVEDGCSGNFQIKESQNVYQKGRTGIYLYFNPSIFQWVCGKQGKTPNKCHPEYISKAEAPGWYIADTLNSNGKTIHVPWVMDNKTMTATITCIATSSSGGFEFLNHQFYSLQKKKKKIYIFTYQIDQKVLLLEFRLVVVAV